MHNRNFHKGTLALAGAALLGLVAWRAPESRVIAAPTPVVATASASPAVSAVPGSSYAPVVERVMPAVVTIRVEKRASMQPTDSQIPDELFRQFFGQGQMPRGQMRRMPQGVERGLGSGVIVSQDGYILTNNHVVDGVDSVKVELPDSRTFTAKVVGTDPATDLAVVRIDAKNLPTLPIGDSDAVKIGDVVLAVGNPLGVGETVTSGIISAKGRQTPDGNDGYQDFLQTDAAINHGNSGGALVNVSGDLIGINSQIMSMSDGNIGLGFAIPSNMAKSVMDQLIKTGTVRRAKLGVTVQIITPDMASAMNLPSTHGALVSSVDSGSPAAQAGVKQGDVITQFNGKAIADFNQLHNAVGATQPGSNVSLQILRNGQTETVHATVGELAAAKDHASTPSASRSGGRFGMTVEPLTPDLAEQAGVPRGTSGVVVTDVDPSGAAAESQLQPGDVIQKADGHAVTTADGLRSALDRKDGKPSVLIVNRKGQTIFLTLRAN